MAQVKNRRQVETLPPKDPRRTALLKKVHVLKRQQGMDDAAWRTMLAENFQVSSSGDLPVEKLVALANHLGGVLPAQQPARRASGAQSRATQRQINYIRKLWSEFARSKDVGSLEVWLNRFHKVARLEWLPRETASKVIAILERETGHA